MRFEESGRIASLSKSQHNGSTRMLELRDVVPMVVNPKRQRGRSRSSHSQITSPKKPNGIMREKSTQERKKEQEHATREVCFFFSNKVQVLTHTNNAATRKGDSSSVRTGITTRTVGICQNCWAGVALEPTQQEAHRQRTQ